MPLLNEAGAAMPEEPPCVSYSSDLQNAKTGQNNLWTGTKATLCPREMFTEIIRKQLLWLPDWWLPDWKLNCFRIHVTMLAYLHG